MGRIAGKEKKITILYLKYMAIRQRKDGRWVVYYRKRDPETGKAKQVDEYFGRGAEGKAAAEKRNSELGLQKRRPPKSRTGIPFSEIAKSYTINKNFSDNSRKHLVIRLTANVLPYFGSRIATDLTHKDMDGYVQKRRKAGVKDSTIAREMTDIKAILNWATKRQPPLIPFNPVHAYQKPKSDDEIIQPPTMAETEAIIEHASPHLVRAILLSYYLGLRPGAVELLCLTWDSMNWDNGTIKIISAQKAVLKNGMFPSMMNLLTSCVSGGRRMDVRDRSFITTAGQ